MNELKKDMLVIVDKETSLLFKENHFVDKNLQPDDRAEIKADLAKVDMLTPTESQNFIFLDSQGNRIEPVKDATYLRAKYFGEPNVYYEASFDSINRINNERLNVYKHLAHLLGVTMIANIEMGTRQKNSGWGFNAGFGRGLKVGASGICNEMTVGGSLAEEIRIGIKIQRTIEERIDKNFIHFEYYDPIELTQERWNEAEKFLRDNGLLYIEDFRNLLMSRNPKYGLKKFDFKQYQYSSDMSKYFSIGTSLGIAISGSVGKVFLKACFGFDIKATLGIKRQFQEYSRDSVLFAMGYDDYNHGISELSNIVEQYKSINNLFDDGKLDDVDVAAKLIKKGLDVKDVAEVTKVSIDDLKKIDEYVKIK